MQTNNYYWWDRPEKDVYKDVFQYVKHIRKNQDYRHTSNRKYLRLYSNYDVLDLKHYNYFRDEAASSVQNRVTLNVVQSMIDTVVAKITKNKPRPQFLTEAGDFALQQKAKNLSQFVYGQFHSTKFYRKAEQAFRDSCIFGTGAVKIFHKNGKMCAERIFIDEIIVDDAESLYGEPRQMHQIKQIHKDVLKTLYPKSTSQIDALCSDSGYTNDVANFQTGHKDMLWVIESWRLPTGSEAKDGKHSISIANHTLYSSEWTKDYFPFVFWRWGQRALGFFGQGIAEQLQGLQLEINKILRTIQVSMHLVSIPKIYLEASSKVVTSHLDNKIGGVIRYAGEKPTNGPLATIPPELFSHLDRLYQRAYQIVGISELSAQSSKPAGLDSGKALREFNDIETERFMDVGQRYEEAFLDAAKIFISEVKDLVESTPAKDLEVTVQGSEFIERIKWSEVNLEEDKYSLHLYPTSSLSKTPSGRLADVQEMLQAGFISPEEGRSLLDFPDLKGFYEMANSPLEDIKRTIHLMIDKGKYYSPEPYQDLELGIEKVQQAYLYYRTREVPEARLDLLRRWIEAAQTLLKKQADAEAQQEMQAAMAAQEQQIAAQQPVMPTPAEGAVVEPGIIPEGAVPQE